MAFIKIFLLLFCSSLWGAEALVKVLETPLLKEPDFNADVVGYARKGEKVIIHNSHIRKELRSAEFLEATEEGLKTYNQKYPEKYLTNEYDDIPEEFIKTTDRLGRDAYIIKDHLAILYHDARELEETKLDYDPTDYRIEEPLPKNYPFERNYSIPYEGILSLGYLNSNDRAYRYREFIKKSSLTHGYTLNAIWSKKENKDKPIFWGYQLQLKSSEARYDLSSRKASEKQKRFGLGLYGHWVFYEKKTFRLNLTGGARFNLYDTTEIFQEENSTKLEESRFFKGPSASIHSGIFYMQKTSSTNVSMILGYDLTATVPIVQASKDDPINQSWWVGGSGERLGPQVRVEQSLYIGMLFVD